MDAFVTENPPEVTKSGELNSLRALQMKLYNVQFDLEGSGYKYCKTIGTGTYGIVCSAVRRETGEPVAIKKVHNVFDNLTVARRTYREMKILRHLRHDNIVRIHEILHPKDACFNEIYFVFDLMESDLHHVIHSAQELTDNHVRYFLYQILRGLKYIHSANVIHRDLKPGNLLVNENCDLKIGDFGMARTVAFAGSDIEHVSLLMTPYVMTRWYRAPELLLFRRQYTAAVDMWSVGCIFAEMLARRVLFPGNHLQHQLTLVAHVLGTPSEEFISLAHSERVKDFVRQLVADPVTFKTLCPTAHPKSVKLLEKMLRWHPDDRISVDDALRDLYLNTYYSPTDLPVCDMPICFPLDEEQIVDSKEMRKIIFDEIMSQPQTSNPDAEPAMKQQGDACNTQPDNNSVAPTHTDVVHVKVGRGHSAVSQSRRQSRVTRKLKQASVYQSILPAASRSYMEDALSSNVVIHNGSGTHEPVDAKAVVRAFLLSDRRKMPVMKKQGKKAKKGNCERNPEASQCPVILTDDDKNLLSRWQAMQKSTNAADTQATDTQTVLTTSRSKPLYFIIKQAVDSNNHQTASQNEARVSSNGVQLYHTGSDTDDTGKTVKNVISTSVQDTASNRVPSSPCVTRADTTECGETSQSTDSIMLNSSHIRLIDSCIAEMAWSPSVAPTSAEVVSAGTKDAAAALDYSPLKQFGQLLTLVDICDAKSLPSANNPLLFCGSMEAANSSKNNVSAPTDNTLDTQFVDSPSSVIINEKQQGCSEQPGDWLHTLNDISEIITQSGAVIQASGSGYGIGMDLSAPCIEMPSLSSELDMGNCNSFDDLFDAMWNAKQD